MWGQWEWPLFFFILPNQKKKKKKTGTSGVVVASNPTQEAETGRWLFLD